MARRRDYENNGVTEEDQDGLRGVGTKELLGEIPQMMPDYGEDVGPNIGIKPPQEELPFGGNRPLDPGEEINGAGGNTERDKYEQTFCANGA